MDCFKHKYVVWLCSLLIVEAWCAYQAANGADVQSGEGKTLAIKNAAAIKSMKAPIVLVAETKTWQHSGWEIPSSKDSAKRFTISFKDATFFEPVQQEKQAVTRLTAGVRDNAGVLKKQQVEQVMLAD